MIKTDEPLVSVIIPAYNAEDYIEESVKSIICQTYKNLEIIIIDDASTDNTTQIIEELKKQDQRITVIANRQNKGVGATRSVGIEQAKGDFIAWQDADDISFDNRISVQVEYLTQHLDVGVVGGYIVFFDKSGDQMTRRYDEHDNKLRKAIFRYNPIAQPASMFRKEVYYTVGSYDEKLTVSEDLDMLFRTGEKFAFANVQQPVLRYRQSATSLTASKLHEMEMVTLRLRKAYRRNPAYRYTLVDGLYNMAQRASMRIPTRLRMKLFQLIRGDKE